MIESVSIIGAGNVASAIAEKLFNEGIKITEIHSKSGTAAILAKKYNADVCTDLSILRDTDLVLICVNDDAIAEINHDIPEKFARAHTSGSVNISNPNKMKSGVFYPLQTFSKEVKIDWAEVPVIIQSENAEFVKELSEFAGNFSKNVVEISVQQRAALHLAAVFACNFSNHMYAIADEFLSQNQLSFDLLKPLIKETSEKAQDHRPADVQTGPAQREDLNVIAKHLGLMEQHPKMKEIYKILSQSIIDLKHGEKL